MNRINPILNKTNEKSSQHNENFSLAYLLYHDVQLNFFFIVTNKKWNDLFIYYYFFLSMYIRFVYVDDQW